MPCFDKRFRQLLPISSYSSGLSTFDPVNGMKGVKNITLKVDIPLSTTRI